MGGGPLPQEAQAMHPRIPVLVLAALALTAVLAHDADARRGGGWYQYAAEFTCGNNPDQVVRALPGDYATAVHVLNPGGDEVMLQKSLSLTFPPELQEPGAVSDAILETLPGRSALQVDCEEIQGGEFVFPGGAPALLPYVQGFVVIESSSPLRVTVRNTAQGASGELSVDVEEVTGYQVSGDVVGGHKVDVCHKPNRRGGRTLNIAMPAVPAHLGHGDVMGACGAP